MPAIFRRAATRAAIYTCVALLVSSTTQAQSAVDPQAVEFNASADHWAVSNTGDVVVAQYSLEIYEVGASQPFNVCSLGKPSPGTDGRIRVPLAGVLTQSPVPNVSYMARVSAVGPSGASASDWSNTFLFGLAPGAFTNGICHSLALSFQCAVL